MATPAWIGLGSNLGDRKAALDAALAALAATPGVAVVAVSSYHETRPVGGPPGQGAFLNAAARLETTLGPFELLAVAQEVENRAGRVRSIRWGERTLDVDLLMYASKFLDAPGLKLPHPRLPFRRFVLAPLAEIAPTIVDVTSKRSVADLLANLDRKPRLLALDGPPGPLKSAVFRRLVAELPASGVEGEEVGRAPTADHDPIRAHLEGFSRKIEALRPDRRGPESTQTPWIMADYCLAFDFENLLPDLLRIARVNGRVEGRKRDLIDEARSALTETVRLAIPPTLTLILPGSPRSSRSPRTPGRAPIPMLWPESATHDGLVAEVLAICRGVEDI